MEKKSGRIFCVRQVYCTKSCEQVWVRVNQPFIPFKHHIWGEIVLWGTVFIIQSSDRMQYFTILQYKVRSFNIQDDRSMREFLANPLKKFPNHIWPAGSHFCRASCGRIWMNINRVTLQHNKEFITVIFYLMVLSMSNLQRRFIRAAL